MKGDCTGHLRDNLLAVYSSLYTCNTSDCDIHCTIWSVSHCKQSANRSARYSLMFALHYHWTAYHSGLLFTSDNLLWHLILFRSRPSSPWLIEHCPTVQRVSSTCLYTPTSWRCYSRNRISRESRWNLGRLGLVRRELPVWSARTHARVCVCVYLVTTVALCK